jgi:fumarate reductase flavoprotein subunit
VDQHGCRILDEGLGGISITNDLARLDDPLCATVICDAPIWETAGKAAQIPPNPQLIAGGGTLHRADTIEALAEAAGLPPQSLAATVADYNDAVRFNRLTTLLPERSTHSGAQGGSKRRHSSRFRYAPGSPTRQAASPSMGTAG